MQVYEAYTRPQYLKIPFQAPGRDPCYASIDVRPEDNPARSGQQLLVHDYPIEDTKGFPKIHISVTSPTSQGYAAMYGWIQIVASGTSSDQYSLLPDDLSHAPWIMDPIAITKALNTPFTWFGSEPSLFDGPSQAGVREVDWVARSFLCYVEDAVGNRSRESQRPIPILVVEWGYWIEESRPYVKEVKQADVIVWNQHLDLFRNKFQGWRFNAIGE